MKRLMSPGLFVLVVVAFFLPFISISCDTEALRQGLGEFGEQLGAPEDAEVPPVPSGGFEVSASGFDIVTNDAPEPRGFGELGSALQGELGGELEGTPVDQGSFPGRVFAILALAAAVLGIGLSLLQERVGAAAALILGALAAIFLFLVKNAIDGELGPAALFGFSVSYEYGYWIALLLSIAAAAVGLWRLVEARPAPSPPPSPSPGPPAPGVPPSPD